MLFAAAETRISMNLEGEKLPPLHRAAYDGDVSQLMNLLASGAPVNDPISSGDYPHYLQGLTPLMVAAGSIIGSNEAVQTLLDYGANPKTTSVKGTTALSEAAGSGDSRRVATMLAAGCEATECSTGGWSALAAASGDAESMRLLLMAGASPEPEGNPPSPSGYPHTNPLVAEEMSKCYVASWPPHMIPIFMAASSDDANSIRVLVEFGASPNFLDHTNSTALMHASSGEAVDALVYAGANVHLRNNFDNSALDEALENNQLDVVAALIRAGANIEDCDSIGRTALLKLCSSLGVTLAAARFLVGVGANIHAVAPGTGYGYGTALHCAAQLFCGDRRGKLGDIIRLIVESGLPVDIKDEHGQTALDKAVGDEGIDLSAVEALLELGADPGLQGGAVLHHAAPQQISMSR
jgi:ankyrin repeat protein